MAYKIEILNRAQEEITEAFDYYSKISANVLESFDAELDQVYQRLETNPFYQLRYKNLRVLPFYSFPFIVFFNIIEDQEIVRIYSIFNTHPNPEKYPNQ